MLRQDDPRSGSMIIFVLFVIPDSYYNMELHNFLHRWSQGRTHDGCDISSQNNTKVTMLRNPYDGPGI